MSGHGHVKILFISSRFSGGTGGQAARVARKLREHGIYVRLMDTSHIPVKGIKNPSFAISSTIRALVDRERYDIVQAFNVPSAFAMRCTRARRKVLSIYGVYSEQVDMLHSGAVHRIARLAESMALRWADVITTDSRDVQRGYKERFGVDVRCMAGPLDVKEFGAVPAVKKKRQVVYVGRDSHEKGIDVLRNAENKIDADVIYCTSVGWKEAMTRMKESSVAVVPSRIESSPQVIKEAFYLGVPVVAASVGGVPELITDGQRGILVPPEDPEGLAGAVNRLLSDDGLGSRLAENARQYVMKNLTWEALLPEYIRFYEELAK